MPVPTADEIAALDQIATYHKNRLPIYFGGDDSEVEFYGKKFIDMMFDIWKVTGTSATPTQAVIDFIADLQKIKQITARDVARSQTYNKAIYDGYAATTSKVSQLKSSIRETSTKLHIIKTENKQKVMFLVIVCISCVVGILVGFAAMLVATTNIALNCILNAVLLLGAVTMLIIKIFNLHA